MPISYQFVSNSTPLSDFYLTLISLIPYLYLSHISTIFGAYLSRILLIFQKISLISYQDQTNISPISPSFIFHILHMSFINFHESHPNLTKNIYIYLIISHPYCISILLILFQYLTHIISVSYPYCNCILP